MATHSIRPSALESSALGVASGRIEDFSHDQFPIERLREARAESHLTVSVCLPARNEARTVGAIVGTLRDRLLRTDVIDELVVVDDHSTDDTAAVARRAGATVVDAETVLPEYGAGHGKGEVLWKSLHVTHGDIVVWCDADIASFHERFVTGVAGPLLCHDDVWFVKGWYERPEEAGEGGGRVTELAARPLLSAFFPPLCQFRQPLSGEYGGRRSVLERVPFVEGYGVDVGLLIDLSTRFGVDGMAQVDLDVRHHRNRPLDELGPQAMAVSQTILHKARPDLVPPSAVLSRPGRPDFEVEVFERPPLIELDSYVRRSA